MGLAASLLCRVGCVAVGVVLAALRTHRVLQEDDVEPLRAWLFYWVIWALWLFVIEGVLGLFVTLPRLLPFYYETKFVCLSLLVFSRAKYAQYFYERFLYPTFSEYIEVIDALAARTGSHLTTYASRVRVRAREVVAQEVAAVLRVRRSESESHES